MARSTRPTTDTERDACIVAVRPLVGKKTTPRVEAELELEFVPARDDYLAARVAWRRAKAAEQGAGDAADTASSKFDAAFRRWATSVKDKDGKAIPTRVAGLFGGVLPGRLVRLPHQDKVTRTRDLAAQVAQEPELAGNAAYLTALMDAHRALEARTAAEAHARAARVEASSALTAAEKEFDLAWGMLARKLKTAGLTAVVPVFVRSPEPTTEPEIPAQEEAEARSGDRKVREGGAKDAKDAKDTVTTACGSTKAEVVCGSREEEIEDLTRDPESAAVHRVSTASTAVRP